MVPNCDQFQTSSLEFHHFEKTGPVTWQIQDNWTNLDWLQAVQSGPVASLLASPRLDFKTLVLAQKLLQSTAVQCIASFSNSKSGFNVFFFFIMCPQIPLLSMLPSSINFMQRIWMLSSYSRKTLNFVGIFPKMHFLQLPSTVVVEFTLYGILTLPMWHVAGVLYRHYLNLAQSQSSSQDLPC